MSGVVDVAEILERAGADASAPEGSQAWALAQVGAVAGELVKCCVVTVRAFESLGRTDGVVAQIEAHRECERALIEQKAALARFGASA